MRYIKHILSLLGILCIFISCTPDKITQIKWVSSTADSLFKGQPPLPLGYAKGVADVNIHVDEPLKTFEGFGATFSEVGWQALSALKDSDRKQVLNSLFSKDGLMLTHGVTPVGASMFSTKWYSYAEQENDFELSAFSIDQDKEDLIPFIKAAQKRQPELHLTAIPWSPPSWMKNSNHYTNQEDSKESNAQNNRLKERRAYFQSYALYLQKYITAYKEEDISIQSLAIQNEMNSTHPYPSCEWTPRSVNFLVDRYLGLCTDTMGIDLVFGTLADANTDYEYLNKIADKPACRFFSTFASEQISERILDEIGSNYLRLRFMQTKTDTGSGNNTWDDCLQSWETMKAGISSNAFAYIYHNIAQEDSTEFLWGGKCNSLITVNKETKSYRYNPEFYLLMHNSHFIHPGAKRLETSGQFDNLLAFLNPDRSVVIVVVNTNDQPRSLNIGVRTQMFSADIKPLSINTFLVPEITN